MSPVANRPVEHEGEKKPASRNHHVSAAPCAAGRQARRTNGSPPAVANGTRSTRAASGRSVFANGVRRNVSHVRGGRHTRSGTLNDSTTARGRHSEYWGVQGGIPDGSAI